MALPVFIAAGIWGGLSYLLNKIIFGVLIYALYKLLITYSGVLISWALDFLAPDKLKDSQVHFSGFGAWIIESLKLADCFSLFISFGVIVFIIRLVRG